MAIKALVTNPSSLEKQMVGFVQAMTQEKGEFALVMLVPSDTGLSDRWTLVVSATWIDRAGGIAAIPTITSGVRTHLSKVNASKLERVSVLPTNDPLVGAIEGFRIQPGEAYVIHFFPQAEGAIVFVAEPSGNSRRHHAQPVQTRA
jgi:hypothetical protein